jgi:thioester reductase-like protein
MAHPPHYLVTGASGVVGSAIVPQLMALPDTTVSVLLRPRQGEDVQARLRHLLAYWARAYPEPDATAGVDAAVPAWADRVQAVAGEITEPLLGLAAPAQAALAARCTHVVHSAASVRMNLPLDEARRSAVRPVEQVVALAARLPALQKVEFVSTVGVGGRWEGPLPERWLPEPREFHNTYEAAKAEAEAVVQRALDGGLPATVHRPSMVVGDSRTGAVIHHQIFYFICEFLSGRRTGGLFPQLGRAALDLVPNDHVAAAIVAASRRPDAVGEVLHLCAGPSRAVSLTALRAQVRETFRRTGYMGAVPRIDLPTPVFVGLMKSAMRFMPERQRRALKGTLPMLMDYLSGVQQFGNDRSRARLAEWGVSAPDPAQVLARVLDAYVADKLARPAR